MPAVKPKLEKLSTPVTATFPSEITSASTATPLSAAHVLCKSDPEFVKTPISPPLAYTNFLSKAMFLGSPAVLSSDHDGPITATSELSDASSKTDDDSSSNPSSPPTSSTVNTTLSKESSVASLASPYPSLSLMSAPPTGAASFPSLKLPPSPAISNLDSLPSANVIRSTFSARSVHTVFDWDAALKARFSELKKHKSPRTCVRNIRKVVTRTVTYTPKMDPAPKGKRRKVD